MAPATAEAIMSNYSKCDKQSDDCAGTVIGGLCPVHWSRWHSEKDRQREERQQQQQQQQQQQKQQQGEQYDSGR
jgi:transcription initiation factor TFIID subunit TAF12